MDISKEYEIYFFDFFGTIMHRKCSGDDIKKIWSNQLALLCKCKSVSYTHLTLPTICSV